MDEVMGRDESLRKLRELIEDIEVASLTTLEADGSLRSRPMVTQRLDEEGALWFFTNDYSPKVQEVQLNPHVGLTYASPEKNRWVSVSGTAELVHDKATLERFWHPMLKAWFPKGMEDPDLALLRVEITHAQYWDAPSSRLVQLSAIVKAVAKGESASGMGETEKLTFKTRLEPDTVT